MNNQKTFYHILINSFISTFGNTFLWFCLVFWAYIETRSVLVTSLIGGLYLAATLISGIFFGAIVDHNKKKNVMIGSNLVSLLFYLIAAGIFFSNSPEIFQNEKSLILWLLSFVIMIGVVVGNIRMIALSTSVSILIEENERDKANGLVGIANGIAFSVVSIFSGLTVGQLGMGWALIFTLIALFISIIHLFFIKFESDKIASEHEEEKKLDLIGTIKIVAGISGLFSLLFFATFNNFLGGVFMSLMDPYGLSLVSVETWGFIWGFLSLGFLVGGALVSKWGLGKNPIKTLLLVNVIMWIVCIFFTSYSSIYLTVAGLFVFMCLHPYAEASEQTILQKVVPLERQGRVFGFGQSLEQIASPLTAFFIGPIAEFFVIPFMNSERGVNIFGSWFGTGDDRAMALIFSVTGIIGLIVTLLAFTSKAYRNLSDEYKKESKEVN